MSELGVLVQCPTLSQLRLGGNQIGDEVAGRPCLEQRGVAHNLDAPRKKKGKTAFMTITTRKSRTGVQQKDEDAVEGDDEDDQGRIRSTRVDQGK